MTKLWVKDAGTWRETIMSSGGFFIQAGGQHLNHFKVMNQPLHPVNHRSKLESESVTAAKITAGLYYVMATDRGKKVL